MIVVGIMLFKAFIYIALVEKPVSVILLQ